MTKQSTPYTLSKRQTKCKQRIKDFIKENNITCNWLNNNKTFRQKYITINNIKTYEIKNKIELTLLPKLTINYKKPKNELFIITVSSIIEDVCETENELKKHICDLYKSNKHKLISLEVFTITKQKYNNNLNTILQN